MDTTRYQRLGGSSEECSVAECDQLVQGTSSKPTSLEQKQRRIILFQWVLIGIIVLAVMATWVGAHTPVSDQVYSPAQEALRYKEVVFRSSVTGDMTEYQGPPTPERNKAWEDLYNFGISKIPMSQAARLPNKTFALPDDPGYYVVELDVFHQLHCLNMIRKKIWGAESPEYKIDDDGHTMDIVHMDHCIDSMRQSFMCSADISTITWTWIEEEKMAKGRLDTLHSCRDFEAIRQWAVKNRAVKFNKFVHIPDPLSD